MKTTVLALAALATMATAAAKPPALNAPEQRITDSAIHADQATFARQQAAIKAANDAGQPVASHALAKAQCWLDVAFHEYSRNDRTDFPAQALQQSVAITDWLASRGGDNPALNTPLVAGAERLREDLWAAAAALSTTQGAECAQRQRACAEVELVHAGHEYAQIGWRHAKPYVQLAEDTLQEGRAAAAACVAAPAVVSVPVPAPAATQRSVEVYFGFDRRDWAGVRDYSAAALDALLREIKPATITRVLITGHADISNRTGQANYNQRLSEDRAQTVVARLVAAGVAADRIETAARADHNPVKDCSAQRNERAAYQACLLPNRRVDVVVETAAAR